MRYLCVPNKVPGCVAPTLGLFWCSVFVDREGGPYPLPVVTGLGAPVNRREHGSGLCQQRGFSDLKLDRALHSALCWSKRTQPCAPFSSQELPWNIPERLLPARGAKNFPASFLGLSGWKTAKQGILGDGIRFNVFSSKLALF